MSEGLMVWRRGQTYSQDLREEVLAADDLSARQAAERFVVSVSFVIRARQRRTGLSRNTIRKYLRTDVVEAKFTLPGGPRKLDPFSEKLTGWLRQEAGKSRKQKCTTKQLHADLAALSYDGSYGRVATFVRC
jgi:transposase